MEKDQSKPAVDPLCNVSIYRSIGYILNRRDLNYRSVALSQPAIAAKWSSPKLKIAFDDGRSGATVHP
jgi:hypothetical protein